MAGFSPSSEAGLIPEKDYILGSPHFAYENEQSLLKYLRSIESKGKFLKTLDLVVYNSDSKLTRNVKITPSRDWDGDGAIGFEYAVGMLNYLP